MQTKKYFNYRKKNNFTRYNDLNLNNIENKIKKTIRRPEQDLHKIVFEYLNHYALPESAFIVHYPAGGYRTAFEAKLFKSLGTVSGMPDLMIFYNGNNIFY